MSRWKPRPDPAIHDPDRPGLHPRLHEPNRLWPWVFGQDEVWVDYWGNEHEIKHMASDYLANVIEFCRRQALRIALIVAYAELFEDESPGAAGTTRELEELYQHLLEADKSRRRAEIAERWLGTTELVRALRAEIARRQRPLHGSGGGAGR